VREAIRSDGYSTWTQHRDILVSFAAMLAARSLLFRAQSSSEVFPSLAQHPEADLLAKNYSITRSLNLVTQQ
jgi:hypothetical protein